jgi:hypothetical protein
MSLKSHALNFEEIVSACASHQHVGDHADSPAATSRAFADEQVKVQITPERA